jgi:hypothetical protein
MHEGAGSVGSAVPERVWERRLELFKEMDTCGFKQDDFYFY